MNYAKFGPGGNGDWFRADGMKNALQTPGWLQSKGIDAFEYEATRGVNASECLKCGQCEAACPQHIDIITRLEQAAEMFE